jgi:hypothetical protein
MIAQKKGKGTDLLRRAPQVPELDTAHSRPAKAAAQRSMKRKGRS